MDEIDRKLLAMVQDCFPLTPRPFLDIGIALGLDEKGGHRATGSIAERGPGEKDWAYS